MTIGEKIRYYRKKHELTQQQLADASGIHPVSIRKYETNKMTPQPKQLKKIAKALGINYVALLSIEEDRDAQKSNGLGDILTALIENGFFIFQNEKYQFNPILERYLEIETNSYQIIPLSSIHLTERKNE